MSVTVKSCAESCGIIDVECSLSNNLPQIVIVGFANRAVDEARERVRGAFASSNLKLPRKRITINLAPADIPKDSTGFDLPIAAAIIQAMGSGHFEPYEALLGELGLDGSLRPIRGIIGKILAGRAQGLSTFYVPLANLDQAYLIPDIELYAIDNLKQLAGHASGQVPLASVQSSRKPLKPDIIPDDPLLRLGEIAGQQSAKRGLEIAAAGGHNILLTGPPGAGKTMLARALPGLLPAMTIEETLAVTQLHSLAVPAYDKLVRQRPFQAPHHSASQRAILGGGRPLRPGQISLAHHGVLFLDEFPEFDRATIEALRQPLEDRAITLTGAHGSLQLPANFILVTAANPCPCGYSGLQDSVGANGPHCNCPAAAIARYQAKLTGPVIDRVDLHCYVGPVDLASLLPDAAPSAASYRQVSNHCELSSQAKKLLDQAATQLGLSARSYMRTLKVARTIADLEGKGRLLPDHISEALYYRRPSGPSSLTRTGQSDKLI